MSEPLRLITIGFSHYCEKARWALDRSALAYREEDHAPLFHVPACLRAGGGRTVPKLVTPTEVLSTSTQILHYVDEHLAPERRLFPEDETQRAEVVQWVEEFDRGVGPAVRRYLYFQMLKQRDAMVELLTCTGSAWERRMVRAGFPVIRALIVRGLKISPSSAERSHQRVLSSFAAVGERLADGRRYLVGDHFTAADLSFAALTAVLIQPPQSGFPVPAASQKVPAVAEAMAEARASPAGQYVLRLYAEERPPTRGRG